MRNILEVNNLCKSFSKKQIIKRINFSISEGEIVGFVGPNGAGKTTTLKLITNLIYPDKGEIIINGYDILKDRVKALSNIAAIIENPGLYKNLSGKDNLEFIRRIRNTSKDQMNYVINYIGLKDRIYDKVRKYSLGMKQRLALGMCLLSNPKFLILDEPTNGLDPDGTMKFRDLISEISKKQRISVLFSSHLLSEVEKVSDRIIFIKNGEIVSTKNKNIITILIFCILIITYAFINNSLDNEKQLSQINSYKDEIISVKNAMNDLSKNGKTISKAQNDILDNYKNEYVLLENRLKAKSSNDWKTELYYKIKLDKQLLSNIETGKVVSGENTGDLKERLKLNQALYKYNIKPIIEENSMTSYNFIRLASKEVLPMLSIIIILILSADFVSSESDEGTFKFLLIQPISRKKILFSKIISSSLICVLTEFIILFAFFIVLGLINGFGSPFYPTEYYTGSLSLFLYNKNMIFTTKFIGVRKFIILALLLNLFFIVFIVSFGILISTIMQNNTGAICISIIIAISVSIFNMQLKLFKSVSHLIPFTYSNSIEILNGNMISEFNNKSITYASGILILILFTLIFYFISCFIFEKKDITC